MIAEMAKVSPTTVMNVLHGRKEKMRKETYERVERVIAETGYVRSVMPSLLSGKRKRLLGVIVGKQGTHREVRNQCAGILFLFEKEAFINEYYVLIHVSENIKESIRFIREWKMGGVVTFAMNEEERETIQKECRIPVRELEFQKTDYGTENILKKQIKDFLKLLTDNTLL